MFKHLHLFRTAGDLPTVAALSAAMEARAFAPCGPTQPSSAGWVPPRGQANGPMVEAIGGHWIAALQVETKLLPAQVVKRHTDALADKIEQETGRRPKGKRLREVKEEAVLQLLPQAFTKRAVIRVWIDPKAALVCVDSSSSTKADTVAEALIDCAGRMNLAPLSTKVAPGTFMANLLLGDVHADYFNVDRQCELREPMGDKAVVRYQRQALDTDEVAGHVEAGKLPTKLALIWAGRVSFVLADSGALRGITLLDVQERGESTEEVDAFDADVAIATGELSRCIADLIEALGGAQDLPIEEAAKEPQADKVPA